VLTGRFDFGTDPLWVQTTGDVLQLVAAGACLVTGAWWQTIRAWSPAGGATIVLTAIALATAALPGAANSWVAKSYSAPERAAFTDWRGVVPRDAEVLWPDGLQETWFLLGRRSYLTVSQLGGIVFSADLASEARRRANLIAPLVPPGHWFVDPATAGTRPAQLTTAILAEICVAGGPDFVVDNEDLGIQVSVVEWPTRAKQLYLYDCAMVRRNVVPAKVVQRFTETPGNAT
jgi:hypothetical protein